MKRYVLSRPWAHARCTVVVEDGRGMEVDSYELRHLVHHSPTGFEWGYAGSGPSDLARSIVGDLLGTVNPDPAVYQRVKLDLLVDMNALGGVITEEQLRASIEASAHA